MAEGDTILRVSRRLDETLAGRALSVRTPGPRRPEGLPAERLDGSVLERAESRGKHLLLHFQGGLALHSHLGMRGSWRLHRDGERWPMPATQAWIALSDGDTEAVNFGGSSLRIATEAGLRRDPRLARLGPDLLADGFEPAAGVRSLRRLHPEVELGEALLDQSAIAGIGNIFKSEGCFAARLDPWQPLAEFDDESLAAVLEETRALMLAAADGRDRARAVYRRAGTPCPRCGARVRARKQGDAARTTYWCPRCQGAG